MVFELPSLRMFSIIRLHTNIFMLYMLGQLTSVEVLHHIIGGVVLLEHLVHPHDMA